MRIRPGSTIHSCPVGESFSIAVAICCTSFFIPASVGFGCRRTIRPAYLSGGYRSCWAKSRSAVIRQRFDKRHVSASVLSSVPRKRSSSTVETWCPCVSKGSRHLGSRFSSNLNGYGIMSSRWGQRIPAQIPRRMPDRLGYLLASGSDTLLKRRRHHHHWLGTAKQARP